MSIRGLGKSRSGAVKPFTFVREITIIKVLGRAAHPHSWASS